MMTVLIPAYNEGTAIGGTIAELQQVFASAGMEGVEILVVDDGSDDGTGAKAAEQGATVLRNPHNLGYGWSLKRGIEAARHDAIVITDADLTYPAQAIPGLWQVYQDGFDMVVGQRTGPHYHESAKKAWLRRILRLIVEFAAGRAVPDINSGLRIFRRQTAMGFFSHLCNTFSFTTTLTLAYMMNGKFVKYVPIEYRERDGKTKVKLIKDSLRTMQYIAESIIYFDPMKAFILLSVAMVIGSVFNFLLGAVTDLHVFYYFGVGGVMLAVLSICFGFLAVLLKQIMQQGGDRG